MIPSVSTKLHLLMLVTFVAVALYMYFLYKDLRTFQDDIKTMKSQIQGLLHNAASTNPSPVAPVCPSKVTNNAQATTMPMVKDGLLTKPATLKAPQSSNTLSPVINTNEDDEDMSVTSNEIKDLLTNIQDVEFGEEGSSLAQEVLKNVSQPEPEPELEVQAQAQAHSQTPASDTMIDDKSITENPCGDIEKDVIILGDTIDFMGAIKSAPPMKNLLELSDEEVNKCSYDEIRAFLRKKGYNMKGSKQGLIDKLKELRAK
jgi:hypothetical protein